MRNRTPEQWCASHLTIPSTVDRVAFGSTNATKTKVHYSVFVDSAPFASWRYSQLYRRFGLGLISTLSLLRVAARCRPTPHSHSTA